MNNNILSQKRITQAEREVLRYLVKGLKNEEMARKLCVSVSTIKKHLESIYDKLSVHNRLQAIHIAFVQDDIE